jgi:hypothetical protein
MDPDPGGPKTCGSGGSGCTTLFFLLADFPGKSDSSLRWNSLTAFLVEVTGHILKSSQSQVFVWFSTNLINGIRRFLGLMDPDPLFFCTVPDPDLAPDYLINKQTVKKTLISTVLIFFYFFTVLRIRDVYPRSQIRFFSIPDPTYKFFPSQIPDPHQRIEVF